MATQGSTQGSKGSNSLLDELPVDRLKDEAINLGKVLAKRGAAKLGERLAGAPGKLGDLTDTVPGPKDMAKAVGKAASPLGSVKGAASKVKDALPGTGSDDEADEGSDAESGNAMGDDTDLKVTNIVESIDVPVSREIAYELWTQFEEFPSFMKKVEAVNQKDPEVVTWKAQIFWSHRTWTAKIVDQVPPERIVWKSEADKGKVDGAVTFHELAPDLTRVLVSLEYFPQGLFERTGNLWRAQGRRVRLELKHFRRYVANHALINQDEVDGWTGEIHDGKVKRRRSSSTAKKSASSNGSTAKKSASSNGSTAKKSASSGSSARKSASSSTAAKKSSSSRSTAKKSASNRPTAKKSPSNRPTAKKSSSSRPAAKKSASGSTARKRTAKKAGSRGASKRTAAAAKKSTTTSKRTSPASSRSKSRTSRSKS